MTLNGASNMTVECHTVFSDPGATASDACAGDLTSAIHVTGSVDANTVGSYTLTYTATDAHGNTATATRTVNVVDTLPPTLTLNVKGDTVDGQLSEASSVATSSAVAGTVDAAGVISQIVLRTIALRLIT